ncbi:hemerythrin domain-containing protein [Tomitella biformata]|uniref:hemerythrin domain-containing protein n=1 Tax=Tomitella biformata TaxID=630403 RepID=UPI0004B5B3DD|nr:hemerythrin domain-containing protein [Tomitella biformata]
MRASNANEVLAGQHRLLRALTDQLDETTAGSSEHRGLVDQVKFELDIHMQIEDRLYYPAVRRGSPLVGIAHAEHRAPSGSSTRRWARRSESSAVAAASGPSSARFT